jgi:hypothetical protein
VSVVDNAASNVNAAPDTLPTTTQPAKAPKLTLEELLEFQESLPKVATQPGDIVENPLMTELLKKKIAEKNAEKNNEGGAEAAESPEAEAAPAPEATAKSEVRPMKPTTVIHRILMSQQDGKTYACLSDGDTIYELDDKQFEDATAEMHDPQIFKFDIAEVTELGMSMGGETFSFRKGDKDEWTCLQDPVLPIDKEKVKEVLNDLRDLKTHRYVSYKASDLAPFGLGEDAKRLSVALIGGTREELVLSDRGPEGDADNSRYAMPAGTKKVFLLKGEQVEKLDKKLEHFEQEAPAS